MTQAMPLPRMMMHSVSFGTGWCTGCEGPCCWFWDLSLQLQPTGTLWGFTETSGWHMVNGYMNEGHML